MFKKVLILCGIVALVGVLVFGTSAVSYIRTSAGYVADSARDAFPVGFEIDRARGMLRDLEPDVRENMYAIAKEKVEIKKLEEQIAALESRLDKEKDDVLQLRSDLATGEDVFQYAGRNYTAEQVETDLANRFERFKTGDATLANLRQMHNARQKSLDAAQKKLEGLLAAKRQCEVEIENLQAKHKMVAAAQASSQYQFDDSRLGRVKELVSNLKTRLEVDAVLAESETYFHDEIPLDEDNAGDVVDQVTEYFNQQPEVEAVAVDTVAADLELK